MVVESMSIEDMPSQAIGKQAYIIYDPDGYDWEHWTHDPDIETGWQNFDSTVIERAVDLENLNGYWDSYDAGSIFVGDYESVKRLDEVLEKLKAEYGGIDIYAGFADFSLQIEIEETEPYDFTIENEDGDLIPVKVNINIETDYYGKTWVWVSPSNLIFAETEMLGIIAEKFPNYRFQFGWWSHEDSCISATLDICDDEEDTSTFVGIVQGTNGKTLAHAIAEACGLEVIVA